MSEIKYKIKITPKAYDDLDGIYAYIAKELSNPSAAENLMAKFESSIMRLQDFPLSCSFVEDDTLKNKGYRNIFINNYIAFYIVDEMLKQVIIMRVLYGGQKYQDRI